MDAENSIQDVFRKFAGTATALRRRSSFTCGDCERSDRCGLPPNDRCIFKAAQIAPWRLENKTARQGAQPAVSRTAQFTS